MPSIKVEKVTQGGHVFLVGAASGKLLRASSAVSRRAEDPQEGFNRELNKARAREIAAYLDSAIAPVPTSIVLSAQESAQARFSRGSLEWEESDGAFLVLDGQHRLFSMDFTESDYDFSFAIFTTLSRREEVRLFIDINTKQRGVPSALLLDIKKLAGTETDSESILRDLFDFIASDERSPLKGLMSPAKAQKGRVSRTTFNNALRPALDSNAFSSATEFETVARMLVNYLQALEQALDESGSKNHSLTTATTLSAFFQVFDEVVNKTMARAQRLRPEDFHETIAAWSTIDFDSFTGSNNATRARLTADLRSSLHVLPTLTPDLLG